MPCCCPITRNALGECLDGGRTVRPDVEGPDRHLTVHHRTVASFHAFCMPPSACGTAPSRGRDAALPKPTDMTCYAIKGIRRGSLSTAEFEVETGLDDTDVCCDVEWSGHGE